jgi:hypothetical protein
MIYNGYTHVQLSLLKKKNPSYDEGAMKQKKKVEVGYIQIIN